MPVDSDERLHEEMQRVFRRRYLEARQAGLSRDEARVFAESGCDIGVLRHLVRSGCPVHLLARIVT